ncbi:MAG TPA: ATP-binding protein, partial [Beijerinckiaceae bacterium]
ASMSVSILVDGALWGLVSCHNKEPRRVSLQARNACDLLTQIFALQLAARERAALVEERVALGSIQSRLLGYMAEEERFLDGLTKHPDDVLALARASGFAIVSQDQCRISGVAPSADCVRAIHQWIASAHAGSEVVALDDVEAHLPGVCPPELASGLLAISISQRFASYIIWFRPELVRTVRWGGDPNKPASQTEGGPARLHPRRSFDTWKQIVRGRSEPWSAAVIEAAKELRSAVIGVVLRRAEELASLSEDLQRSNKELEAFSYSVSHDLRAPFRHIVGYSELLRSLEGERLSDKGRRYIETIIDSAYAAGTLVDSLLAFSQLGRASLTMIPIDMNALVGEARRHAMLDVGPEREIRWVIGDMPSVKGDPTMLRLAIENLLSNALKYTRGREVAIIEVGVETRSAEATTFYVRDNGVGFDMAYVGKLFGVFQRLHRAEEFEGTGIGLANVRRIVERHGGSVWAEGELGRGATFFFCIPEPRSEDSQ